MKKKEDLTQQLKTVLCNGDERLYIYYYLTHVDIRKDCDNFIKLIFNRIYWNDCGVKGICIDENKYSLWYQKEGVWFGKGQLAMDGEYHPWFEIVELYKELIEEGKLLTNDEYEYIEDSYIKFTAKLLCDLCWDMDDNQKKKIFPMVSLGRRETTCIQTNFEKFLRKRYKYCEYFNSSVKYINNDYQIRQTKLISELLYAYERSGDMPEQDGVITELGFIPNDAMNYGLSRGSNFSNGDKRILKFFTEAGHSLKEQGDFLKEEFGMGGSTFISNTYLDYSPKGIKVEIFKNKIEPLSLSWNNAAKVIDWLISNNAYCNYKSLYKIK